MSTLDSVLDPKTDNETATGSATDLVHLGIGTLGLSTECGDPLTAGGTVTGSPNLVTCGHCLNAQALR